MEDTNLDKLLESLIHTYQNDSGINFIDVTNLPLRDKILEVLDDIMELLFPGYTGKRIITKANLRYTIGDIICKVRNELIDQIERALHYQCRIKDTCEGCDCHDMAEKITDSLLERLPTLRRILKTDVQAAFDGDPAAKSFEEIVISYPGIITIATHRVAHELYNMQVPLLPRIMSESAHRNTGIDIHPGATIDESFFIDHGTGVVIGETARIGRNVKIYQGVTLGALSFPKDERGRIIKGGKRHPTIEDGVTIYAEATILGDIIIGEGSVIGGNVWIKETVDPHTTVLSEESGLLFKTKNKAK